MYIHTIFCLKTCIAAQYRYYAGGKRDLKMLGTIQDAYIQGHWWSIPIFEDAVLYAGDLMTVDKQYYQKHYFMESERFLTNIGGGETGNYLVEPNTELQPIKFNDAVELSNNFTTFAEDYFIEHPHEINIINQSGDWGSFVDLFEVYNKGLNHNVSDVQFYWHSDRLGNGSVVTNQSGNAEQILCYQPFGRVMLDLSLGYETEWQFGAYNFDRESRINQSEARGYLGEWGVDVFNTVDPMWHLYSSLTSYHYAANNPLRYTDPTGMKVKPSGNEELEMIQNTLTPEDRKYVRFDKNGNIDKELMNSHKSESENYNALSEQVNSDLTIHVKLSDYYFYVDNDNKLIFRRMGGIAEAYADVNVETSNGLSTGEGGLNGQTLLPGRGKSGVNSINNDIHVIINKNLSPLGRAETYSHEANGHSLLYVRTRNRRMSGHMPLPGCIDGNKALSDMSKKSRKETIQNMGRAKK